jgi:hypothetical protein
VEKASVYAAIEREMHRVLNGKFHGFAGGRGRTMKEKSKQIHGLRRLKDTVNARGMRALDARTSAVKDLIAWRDALVNALGGPEHVSPQKTALIEMATRTRLFVDHIDAYILSQPSLVNKRRKGILPIVRERQSLVDSLERILSRLGLERVPKPLPSLQEYLESKEHEEAQSAPQDDTVQEEALTDEENKA